jgi:hypothetical protein
MIQFIDNSGAISTQEEFYDLSLDIRPDAGSGVTIALLANGFPDSELFTKKVGAALEARLPNVRTLFWNKHNAGVAANDEMLDEIVSQCDVAVAAYGH